MFAKPKSALPGRPRFSRPSGARPSVKELPKIWLNGLASAFKNPFVAPLTALCALAVCGVVFLHLASDPNAGSPSVQISLDRPKAVPDPAPKPADDASAGMSSFTLDSLGMFQDTTADGFNLNTGDVDGAPAGTAVITMPGATGDMGQASSVPKAAASPLPQAPIAGLVQSGASGPLPTIAPSGLTPAVAYARPFKSDGRPMVALVVGSLGLNPTTTRQAIETLPPQVTLSFVPYTTGLQGWIDLARASGHEVMIEVPMQPTNYPDNDPGPQTLMANAGTNDIINRLNWALSRATGYFAVSNYQGSAFFRDKAGMATFTGNLKSRGVAFIDDGQARGFGGAWGRASADRIVDNQINASAIMAQLAGLEAQARSHGSALGTGFAYPVTLAVAQRWTQTLESKGLQLAPASAVVHQ